MSFEERNPWLETAKDNGDPFYDYDMLQISQ